MRGRGLAQGWGRRTRGCRGGGKRGHGCEPVVHIAFRLATDPTLGRFLLSSATWTFADHAMTVKVAPPEAQRSCASPAGD